MIIRINFYSGKETLVQVGEDDNNKVNGVKESFEIAADEQLIGAELEYARIYFCGVTWYKCKIAR